MKIIAVDGRSEGSMTVELVVLAPLIVMVALFVVAFGRIELAKGQVGDAARAAAQAAVVWSSSSQASQAASMSAASTLSRDGITCSPFEVNVESGGWHPGGSIGVSVQCTVSLSQVALPGLPGSEDVSAHVVAPIEPYRSIQ